MYSAKEDVPADEEVASAGTARPRVVYTVAPLQLARVVGSEAMLIGFFLHAEVV